MIYKETARETFRQAVLDAMDRAARQIFGNRIHRNDAGATDADLPRLFRALDAQLAVLAERYGVALVDYDPAILKGDPRFDPFAAKPS